MCIFSIHYQNRGGVIQTTREVFFFILGHMCIFSIHYQNQGGVIQTTGGVLFILLEGEWVQIFVWGV